MAILASQYVLFYTGFQNCKVCLLCLNVCSDPRERDCAACSRVTEVEKQIPADWASAGSLPALMNAVHQARQSSEGGAFSPPPPTLLFSPSLSAVYPSYLCVRSAPCWPHSLHRKCISIGHSSLAGLWLLPGYWGKMDALAGVTDLLGRSKHLEINFIVGALCFFIRPLFWLVNRKAYSTNKEEQQSKPRQP